MRMALAYNPKTPTETLRGLMHGADLRLRINLAGNPGLPEPERRVLLRELLTERDHYVRLWVAKCRLTPVDVLQELLKDRHRNVRAIAAESLALVEPDTRHHSHTDR